MDTQGQGINSNHNGGTYIVNPVLSFVRHGMNVGTETNTIKVANSTFSLGEIKDASVVFWEKCSLGNPPVRQTSVHRTQGCQLSRIWRDSHAFDLLLTHSRN